MVEVRRITGAAGRVLDEGREHVFATARHQLTVTIAPSGQEATTYISRRRDVPLPGSATALYGRAARLMQDEADRNGRPLIYELVTRDPNMRGWAGTYGARVFGWGSSPAFVASDGTVLHRRVFAPRSR